MIYNSQPHGLNPFRINMVNHWLVKSEPDVYPWSKLISDGSTHWDGVRNYQARNIMRDQMKVGDLVLFYHSNTRPPLIAGVARVTKEGYPDYTCWDKKSKYYDPKSSEENPRWIMVDIEPVEHLEAVSLPELRQNENLDGMPLLAKGQRLSVQPVSQLHFIEVCKMGGKEYTSL